ncbi:TPA: Gfo/Idh/MocA family oxidoreductase [Streptococcus agalactiae]|nr:Gfo/Idh/MocA family oxidoreductase [Enterococcus faecalis]HEO1201158.1 Gfo/Idh/MocA family oxidoreductase [Streptococcus agalactiae]HEO1202239.1 Gfo/Idh/MocA family oxidoreductase [Streptococcus agalactiae]
MKKRLKTIVCGTNFGEFYLYALEKMNSEFEIVGIIGRGSERTKKFSKKYNVPLYFNVEELPSDIDLACVIVRSEGTGGDGTELCMDLLSKGIHVIQEQPVYQKHLYKCYKLAREKKLIYLTANLYSNLSNMECFAEYARKLNKFSKLEYISVSFSTQLAYVALDLLAISGISGDLDLDNDIVKGLGPFDILHGRIGIIPILIEFNNQLNPKFPDYNMHLMYSFKFYYEDGLLSINDAYGDVAWRPRTYIKGAKDDLNIGKESIYEVLNSLKEMSTSEFFQTHWIDSVSLELIKMKNYIKTGELDIHRVNRELSTSKKWEILQKKAGYAKFIETNKEKLFLLSGIKIFDE